MAELVEWVAEVLDGGGRLFGLGIAAGGVAGWCARAWHDAARGREMRRRLREAVQREVDARL